MATVVAATIPADEFALGGALRRRSGTEFEALRRVTHGTDQAVPFLWATGRDGDGLPAVVAADPTGRTGDPLTTVERIYDVTGELRRCRYGLTENQQGSIIVAADWGTPRCHAGRRWGIWPLTLTSLIRHFPSACAAVRRRSSKPALDP